jgi:hypothetical protein
MGVAQARSFSWGTEIAASSVANEAAVEPANRMASSCEYQTLAVDCARLAQVAPSHEARAGFAAAARSWLMLARLAGEDIARAEGIVSYQTNRRRNHAGERRCEAVTGKRAVLARRGCDIAGRTRRKAERRPLRP